MQQLTEAERMNAYYRSITQDAWKGWARGQQELYHKDILKAYLGAGNPPPPWLVLNKTAEDREAERKLTWRDYTTDLIKEEIDMSKVAGILGLYAGTQGHSLRDSREVGKKLLKQLNRAQNSQDRSDIVSEFFDDYQYSGGWKTQYKGYSKNNNEGARRGSKQAPRGPPQAGFKGSGPKGSKQSNSYRGQNPNLGKSG
jgi:hypothetical protein